MMGTKYLLSSLAISGCVKDSVLVRWQSGGGRGKEMVSLSGLNHGGMGMQAQGAGSGTVARLEADVQVDQLVLLLCALDGVDAK